MKKEIDIEILKKAVEVIKQWHNFPFVISMLPEKEIERMWNIYYNNAPEMKAIKECLDKK